MRGERHESREEGRRAYPTTMNSPKSNPISCHNKSGDMGTKWETTGGEKTQKPARTRLFKIPLKAS